MREDFRSRAVARRPALRRSPAHATVIATGLFVTGLLCGALAGRAAVARVQDPYAHLDLFSRVLTTVEQDYVEAIPPGELVDAAIEGIVGRLDRQSRWLDADQLQELREDTSGTTTGLGLEVVASERGVLVVAVIEGSPAEAQGLQVGDQILAIDGRSLAGVDFEEVLAQLSGDYGEVAELTVLREGWPAPRIVRTARAEVARRVVHGALLEEVVYVRLSQFQQGSADDLRAEIDQLAEPLGGVTQLRGLVLDVRDNPGGLLSEAVAVTDLFLHEGTIVSTRARGDGPDASVVTEVHRASRGGLPDSLRAVVLINGMSASASEIVAGALQDTGRATLVGAPTYGKGTVQKVYLFGGQADGVPGPTGREAALKLTVGQYFTPSGAPVAPREGRQPDVEVPHPAAPGPVARLRRAVRAAEVTDDVRAELLAALDEVPADRPQRTTPPWDLPIDERLPLDPQLQRALDLLRED